MSVWSTTGVSVGVICRRGLNTKRPEPGDDFVAKPLNHAASNWRVVEAALASKAEEPLPHKGKRTLAHCPLPGSGSSTANVNLPRMRGLTFMLAQGPGTPDVHQPFPPSLLHV